MRPLIVGIAGGSGSGKSTLAAALVEAFGVSCLHVVHDRYYRTLTPTQRLDVGAVNFDHPDALETERLVSDLEDLLSTGRARLPRYDFATHRREGEDEVEVAPIVLVEGILVFTHAPLCERMDLRVYVEASDAVRLARRVRRDVAERGRTEEEVRSRFAATVRPMHDRFVRPTKAEAHLVVDGAQPLERSVSEVMARIRSLRSAAHRS